MRNNKITINRLYKKHFSSAENKMTESLSNNSCNFPDLLITSYKNLMTDTDYYDTNKYYLFNLIS